MLRVMLDTSVYGELMGEPERIANLNKAVGNGSIIVYGCKIIRAELRAIPRNRLFGNKKARILALGLYDSIVKRRTYEINRIIEIITEDYFKAYKSLGGGYGKNDTLHDFLIIACASLHELEMVVSCDIKSMLGEKAVAAYKEINKKYQLKNPVFKPYRQWKEEIKHLCKSSGGRSH